jgi:hypothetical protein
MADFQLPLSGSQPLSETTALPESPFQLPLSGSPPLDRELREVADGPRDAHVLSTPSLGIT